ncbi:Alpha/Beta hydrolase protein [Aspergillus pseudodeflectus]|uniref:Alpha/Beta hydrolase protein n=1 Tax=Aspergillus pseudodeflectus TaxID=176178 RepID=A0ABR4JUZ8_9EURO
MDFPPLHIHPPKSIHTHTAILLHGRGSNGPEFAEELFSSLTSKKNNLHNCLPSWRWVFPTARDRWAVAFEEDICAWFDAYSLTNIQERQELQVEGLRESVAHILGILEAEIARLNGDTSHVYLGGISQGMATALWTVFCASGTGRIQRQLGGILGFCGWLPFADNAEELIRVHQTESKSKVQLQRLVSRFSVETIGLKPCREEEASDTFSVFSILTTPVLLGHGTDDAFVSVELGQQASRVLKEVLDSGNIEWMGYSGADNEGHWIKEPEAFDRILAFLAGPSSEE